MNDRGTLVTGSLSLTNANEQYQLAIPKDAEAVSLSLADATKTWRFSATAGEVAGGGGFPMAAGQSKDFPGRFAGQTLYVAAANASQTLRYCWMVPSRSA